MSATLVVSSPYRGGGKTEQDRIREGEMILRARNAGVTISELMEQTGMSRASVYRRLQRALSERIALTVDEYRAAQDEVLDAIVARHEAGLERVEMIFDAALSKTIVVDGVEINTPDFETCERMLNQRRQTLDSMLKVVERRSRLWGLDKPAEVNVQVTEVTQQDQELAAMIRQAKARAAEATERVRNA